MLMTTEVSDRHAVPVDEPADAEVPERAKRRVFSAQYKLRILAEYERRSPVMRSALLRREGLYTSSISEWRRQRDEGALHALGGTRGRPPAEPSEREVERLRQEVARLQAELGKAQRVIDVQRKLSARASCKSTTTCRWKSGQRRSQVTFVAAHRRVGRPGRRSVGSSPPWEGASQRSAV